MNVNAPIHAPATGIAMHAKNTTEKPAPGLIAVKPGKKNTIKSDNFVDLYDIFIELNNIFIDLND